MTWTFNSRNSDWLNLRLSIVKIQATEVAAAKSVETRTIFKETSCIFRDFILRSYKVELDHNHRRTVAILDAT